MGRMKQARFKNIMNNKKKAKIQAEEDDSDYMEDDIDKFHKGRDKIPLEETESEEDDEFENPVFDLQDPEEDQEAEEDQEELESDDQELPEAQLNSLAAKIEKQAKIMRQKHGIIDDEDDEEEEDEEERDENRWGAKKRTYYQGDNVDFEIQSSDEEGPALEESEARKLQQKISQSHRPEDFYQDYNDESDEEPDTFEKLVEKGERKKENDTKVDSSIPVEKVKKDLSTLSKDEKLQVVMSNAPELVGLLNELRDALHELEHKIQPLLSKMEKWKFITREGKNYVELKHMLLLSYCQSIVFYLLLKAEGRSVTDHPVVGRLVEIRMLLEKVRPLDEKLKEQVEKFLSLDTSAVQVLEDSSKQTKEKNGVKPIDEQQTMGKQQTEVAKPTPEKTEEFIGEESKSMLREMERLEEKAKREKLLEKTRVAQNGKTGHSNKKRHSGIIDDLEDDIGEDVQPKKISQVIAEAGKRQKKPKIVSGDMDLPVREDIGERRRKRETAYSKNTPVEEQKDPDDNERQYEDDYYLQAKQLKLAKQSAKHSKEPITKTQQEEHTGKRLITQEMEKNRGLTPYRKKATKNPRKKYKTKHGKAVIRRKGQVRDIRRQEGPYGGESTGIRKDLSKSIRFG